MRNDVLIIPVILFLVVMLSCGGDYYPKPRGFFRIDLPEKTYRHFDAAYPYSFEYPEYAKLDTTLAKPYWLNIHYPRFKGTIHLSYKPVNNNLNQYLEDTRTMVMKHIPKASSIENRQFVNEKNNVYGLTYDLSGPGTASPFQFYLTDSTDHFVRGALYFNMVPNNDSMAPVIEFIEGDIAHLMETLEWKEN